MMQVKTAYGFWRYGRNDKRAAIVAIETARELGIEHFDVADCYGETGFGDVECLLGEIIEEAPSLFEGVELATKAGVEFGAPYNSSVGYLEKALDHSLRRLGRERVDLFYIHRPDILTHPEEVARSLENFVAAGKAKAIGVSNYSLAQVSALEAYLDRPLSAHQVEFSALHLAPVTDGVFDQAMSRKTRIFAWSPLAGGALMTGGGERAARVRSVLSAVAQAAGVDLAAAALAFVMAHPAAPRPILGTRDPAHLRAAMKAETVQLSRADWYAIFEASNGERLP